ncbi:MAG: DUF4278 domain-containing protein [Nostocales cyanobacterium 94392]|nr:DUF4278 domain-containing protein [Nostocales cyanobacterium 94392]
MLLSYRGSVYKANTQKLATQSNQVNAIYRGVSYQISKPTVFPSLSKSQLKYRGVTYIRGCN